VKTERPELRRALTRAARLTHDTAAAALERSRQRLLERRWASFYRQFLRSGDLCFDIGANIGRRTAIFLRIGARVVAIEPLPECGRVLAERFGENPRFVLILGAAGAEIGYADIRVPRASTIASMSLTWIARVRESGRFADYDWNDSERIRVTTVDHLIREYGVPSFCKIDVEGYEASVLGGLTQAIPALSFEFTPEHLGPTEASLQLLREIAAYEFNLGFNEEPRLMLPRWVTAQELLATLRSYESDARLFGDVYARLASLDQRG